MFPVLQSLHLLISGPTRLQLSSRRAKRGRWAALCLLLAATTCAPWNTAGAQSGLWTWMGGSSTVPGSNKGQPGIYGTLRTPAATNIPGGRGAGAVWKDHSGNIWLLGGYGFDANGDVSYLNDFWELNPSTNEWTWVSGSSTIGTSGGQPGVYGTLKTPAAGNVPGGRSVPSTWTDDNGNLWLFGGYGYDSVGALSTLNDVWEFSPSSKEWTWMGGSSTIGPDYGQSGVYGTLKTPASGNIPGSRYFSTDWIDSKGNFWLFGGYGFAGNGDFGYLNDLWEFNPSTNEWTWEAGSDTVASDGSGPSGVYGTLKTPASGNTPGGRGYSTSWIDTSDNVWLFGGGGFDADGNFGYLNDMWEFSTSATEWTWMGGSNTVVSNSGQPGVYGMLGTPAAGNTPGGRETAIGWSGGGDSLWLFGGSGYDANDTFGSLGDLWELNPSTDEWTWMGGSSTPGDIGQEGVYGTLNTPAAGSFPGSRYYVANWTDSSGNFWLLGGIGQDANNTGGYQNDLWKFQPASSMTSPTPGSALTGTGATFAWSAGTGVSAYDLHLSAVAPGGYDLYVSGHTTRTSATVSGLPTNGGTIYARLYSIIDGVTLYTDYTYTASVSLAQLTSPAPNSTLTSSSVKFTWSTWTAGSQYDLHLSAVAPGGFDLFSSGHLSGSSTTVNGLPTNGEKIYARLYTILNGVTLYNDYTYTAMSLSLAQLTSPAPASTLTSNSVKFAWSTGTAGSQYDLHLSAVAPGGYDLYLSGHVTGTSVTVKNLPTNGGKIYARLYTILNGATVYNDYIYTAASLAKLISPAPSSTLTGTSVTFMWSAGTAVSQYDLHLSAVSAGGFDLYLSGHVTGTSVTVNKLPTNGEKIYARLYTILNGVTLYNDYIYQAF